MPQDQSVTFEYNLHERDASFPDERKSFTVHFTVHEPAEAASSSSLPVLVLLHHFNGSQHYWRPQLEDPQLSSFTKIAVDAPGFGLSTTHGEPWSFDVAAAAVLAILDRQLGDSDRRAVLIGDSMGGMHTSGRAALRDTERKKAGKRARIAGIVPCGTAAEEESVDFVAGYEQDAVDFAKKCSGASPEQVAAHIDDFADNMCKAGYTESPDFSSAREYGRKIIADSLKMSLCNANGVLEGRHAGETMKLNTRILGHRKGLIPELAVRPSPIGDIRALVIHGTDDNAYPFDRKYHERTVSAIGEENAELLVVQGGTHFVTASHYVEVDKKIVEWIKKHNLN